jgi:peptide/nickel transport system permease protein
VTSYIIRRILYGIPIVLGTTLLLFIIFNVLPGQDPALQLAGKHATPETIASIRAELGIDKPLPVQFGNLLKDVVTFDFGRSYATKQRVADMILDGAGPSFSLVAPPFFLTALIALIIGIFVSVYRGTWVDRWIIAIAVAGQSVSILVYILYFQYFFAFKLGWFPISGYDPSLTGRWQYLMLPGIILMLVGLAPSIRFYRTVVLDELYQDYVRTARAKGLTGSAVLFKHVLKNAMIPIITDLVIQLPFLILGALTLESFFGIPGTGDLLVRAIANNDRPVMIAETVLGTIAFVTFNIISDILYALVDPRVQLK